MRMTVRKFKSEIQKMQSENSKLKSKQKDLSKVMDKLRDTQLKHLQEKAAVKHRELEYYSKNDFLSFHRKLRTSFDNIIKMCRDAFRRDARIVANLADSHIHPSGRGLIVKTETHADIK